MLNGNIDLIENVVVCSGNTSFNSSRRTKPISTLPIKSSIWSTPNRTTICTSSLPHFLSPSETHYRTRDTPRHDTHYHARYTRHDTRDIDR